MTLKLDIFSYMSGPGKYASATQTEVVSKFLNGDNPTDDFALNDKNELQISFSDLVQMGLATKQQGQVSISQYTTDIQSSDWVDRACIFGSTSFVLNDDTLFVLGDKGPYIKGAAMLPYDTDFDLTSISPLATVFNEGFSSQRSRSLRDWTNGRSVIHRARQVSVEGRP